MKRPSTPSPYTMEALARSAERARNKVTTHAYDRAQATAYAIRAYRLYRQTQRQHCNIPMSQIDSMAEIRLAADSEQRARIAAMQAIQYAQDYHPRPRAIPRDPPPIQY